MARPQDKISLLAQSQENFDKLQTLIDSLSAEQQAGIIRMAPTLFEMGPSKCS